MGLRARFVAILIASACLAQDASREVAQDAHVFRNALILPVAAPAIESGVLVVENGKITAVGAMLALPRGAVPSGATEHDLRGKVLMPGMVDAHSHLGGPAGGDLSAPINPEVRSLDAIDVMSDSFWRARAGGITTLNVMPGSGHLMSGQTTYLKLRKDPRRIEDWLFCDDAVNGVCGSMKMANGTNSIRDKPFPGTRARSAALVRKLFVEARSYVEKFEKATDDDEFEPPERNSRLEAAAQILNGSRRVQFHTHRHNDILTIIRLAEEFGFKPVIQHGTDSWKVADELAAAGLAVSVTYIDSPGGKEEALGWNMRIGAILEEAGVDVSFNTDDYILDSRRFLRYGALNVRNGMSEEKALEALTLAGARALDLDGRVGSLEVGKDADLVVLSGAPFSVYTTVEQTWVEGQLVYDRSDPEHRKFAVGGFKVYRDFASMGQHFFASEFASEASDVAR